MTPYDLVHSLLYRMTAKGLTPAEIVVGDHAETVLLLDKQLGYLLQYDTMDAKQMMIAGVPVRRDEMLFKNVIKVCAGPGQEIIGYVE
jgi:hypothetical protein